MKQFTIICIGLLFFTTLSAQVGINTENPQKLLHINAGSASSTTDDVVVTEKGTVGIGTINPNENLQLQVEGQLLHSAGEGKVTIETNNIIGTNLEGARIGVGTTPESQIHIVPENGKAPLRLADGSEESSYLLTADANGYASWAALRPMSSIKRGTFLSGIQTTGSDTNTGGALITNKLELTAGKWLIFARAVTTASAKMDGLYMYLMLCEYTTTTARKPISRVGAYATTSSPYIAANQLMYLVEISGTKSYALELASSRIATLSSAYGNYFYAVRLDRY